MCTRLWQSSDRIDMQHGQLRIASDVGGALGVFGAFLGSSDPSLDSSAAKGTKNLISYTGK